MRKILFLGALTLLLACLCTALGEELVMGVGQLGKFADAGKSGVSYASDDVSVLRVDADSGRLSAVKPGKCTVTGSKGGKQVYTLSVTVLKAPTKLSVPESSVQVMTGTYFEAQSCRAKEGEYAGDIEVRVMGTALSVDKKGTLFARETGSAMVYLCAYNGVQVKYEVKVRAKPTSLELSSSEVHLGVGESYDFEYTLLPAFSYSRISWEFTGDEGIVFDPEKLRVSAKGYGSATLTAISENGLKATAKISVLPLPEELKQLKTITAAQGQSGKIGSVLPKGTRAPLKYESLTPDVISVDADGHWTALKGGEGRVRVSAAGTKLYTDQLFSVVPLPERVVLSCPETRLYIGQKLSIKAEVFPAGAYGELSWSSSNPQGVTIDQSGNITAKSFGTSVINAVSLNGVKASLTVTVLKNPESVSINKSFAGLEKGETVKLHLDFPRDSLSSVTYRSLDESVATVDARSGLVTARGGGSTAIIATTANGLSEMCIVSVTPDKSAPSELEMLFMDIDTNDAILLRCGDEYAFIDSGNHNYGEIALQRLRELGVTHLKYYIGTHAHLDHIGGACVILSNLDVDMVIVPHILVEKAIQSSVWTEHERESVMKAHYCVLRHGQTLYLGSAALKCIGPIGIRKLEPSDVDENSNSLVLRAQVGNVSALLTGDATISEFNAILQLYPNEVDCDIFKNTHHAGELSDSQLRAISPKISVFSTSSVRLPSERYTDLLTSLGSVNYITCARVNGETVIYTDGESITVTPTYADNRANWYNDTTGRPE